MHADRTCLICGDLSLDVRTQLVEWRDPVGGRRYEAIPRCIDRTACRSRVEAQGETWPVGSEPVREAV
jgi:hypothetical protein